MSTGDVTLALVNANVLTMQRDHHRAEAVAVAGDRILSVGSNSDVRRLSSAHTQIVDCHGLTLLPGFNDAHCHLPGLARRLQDLDCSPERAPSIQSLVVLVTERAALRQGQDAQVPPGHHPELVEGWVRGHGYDDLQMAERRHPNRWDLDAAAPSHPVWLEHRSGHASALNSRALQLAGIHRETPDPPGGVIERDPATGEPTGVLFEMRSFLRQRLGSTRSPQEFEEGMRAAGKLLNRYGITSVQDAGADNGIERWRSFRQLQSAGALSCRITMFVGAGRLNELAAIPSPSGGEGLGWERPTFHSGDHWLRLGHAKIMLTLTSGALSPLLPELEELIAAAHRRGFPVAIHCIEEEAIAAAAEVLAANPHPAFVDRLEHCAEGTPHLVDAVRACRTAVVTNPGFLYHNGASYRENVEPRLLPHLYPAGALHRAEVPVAFGSDAPVIDPNPWPAIYSAVTRRARDGILLQPCHDDAQAVTPEEALRMYTISAAEVEGTSIDKGSISPGKLADLVLVNADPFSVEPEVLAGIEAVMTVIGGRVVWSNIQGRVYRPAPNAFA